MLPIDTSFFVPQDTAPQQPPNIDPRDFLYLRHIGNWSLSGSPFSDLSGNLKIAEQINAVPVRDTSVTGDTAPPEPFLCEVEYTLTGTVVPDHTCGVACDFVFEVEHFVNLGNPGACREPDVPQDGAVWQLGFDSTNGQILYNYYGTDVWLPWYDVPEGSAPPNLGFLWEFTLAVELEDTAEP